MSTQFQFLVLRARDIEVTREFYEALGLSFERQQHGAGPEHFAAQWNGFVLEIYPLKDGQIEISDSVMLGFEIDSLDATLEKLQIATVVRDATPRFCTIGDPDGRSVRLQEK